MGCTTSKQTRRDFRRSRSLLPASRQPHPEAAAHLAALPRCSPSEEEMKKIMNDRPKIPRPPDTAKKILIPKTPTMTPPNEPETINAWELMAGLDDISPLRPSSAAIDRRAFSFGEPMPAMHAMPELNDSLFVADFDPDIISTFRIALAELSPRHPLFFRSPVRQKSPDLTGIVQARIKLFQERINAKRANGAAKLAQVAQLDTSYKGQPGGEGRVVLYFTSLRGIRETFEDCAAVRTMLKGYGLRVDERDVSMHAGFKEELGELLGDKLACRRLPRVFSNGKYIGGAEEVRQLHEAGELGKALEGCEMVAKCGGGDAAACEGCGDVRFVPCRRCSGSCKLFVEAEEEQSKEEEWGDGSGFRRCPECNENGIVRCSICW